MRPTECKWCGCTTIRAETDSAIHFRCFSSYWPQHDEWNISTNCSAACAVLLLKERNRIQRALERLKSAERYRVAPVSRTHVEWWRTPDGPWAESVTLDDMARILGGDSDE